MVFERLVKMERQILYVDAEIWLLASHMLQFHKSWHKYYGIENVAHVHFSVLHSNLSVN